MITYEAIEANLRMADSVLNALIGDLTDEELMTRPVEGANHIAWQLGHLIGAEYFLVSQMADQVEMAIPGNWRDKYTSETAASDDQGHFEMKDRYLELYAAQRQATLEVLKSLDADQLAGPAPESLQAIASNAGEAFLFLSHHILLHTGQFTCVRRRLGKPILF